MLRTLTFQKFKSTSGPLKAISKYVGTVWTVARLGKIVAVMDGIPPGIILNLK